MTTTEDAGSDRSWLAWHCFAYWEPAQVDEFLTTTVAPVLDRLRNDRRLEDWFFVRYWEGGPHLRIRVRAADPEAARQLPEELVRAVAKAPYPASPVDTERYHDQYGGPAGERAGMQEHGTVRAMPYLPETSRYGGPSAMPVAEDVFCHSSAIAVQVVSATAKPGARLAAAAELTIATGLALGLDQLAAARWLRTVAGSWRWHAETAMLPPAALQAQVARALASKAPALRRRWDQLQELLSGDRPAGTPAVRWASVIGRARCRLEGLDPALPPPPVTGRWWGVWSSQLHMLLNRLGVNPDEERSVCWLVAGACLAPEGPAPFFRDGADAPDRRYQEASKFLPGWGDEQLPREAGPATSRAPFRPRRDPVTLPEPRSPAVPLAEVLRRRMSGRGRLVGPVAAADLSTLVWSAYGVTHTVAVRQPDGTDYQYAHRPYPSAGAAYAARLRLVVREVAGVEPGTYQVDPVDRVLQWIGPGPSLTDLEATSMWFGPATVPQGGIDVAELPVMLGLSVELGRLRQRYGMRALRFAAVEAGHLAQTLALVGTGTGLAVGMIGGFYDDLAHEVFDLDGIDEVLFYLLPVGRPPAVGVAEPPAVRERRGPYGRVWHDSPDQK